MPENMRQCDLKTKRNRPAFPPPYRPPALGGGCRQRFEVGRIQRGRTLEDQMITKRGLYSGVAAIACALAVAPVSVGPPQKTPPLSIAAPPIVALVPPPHTPPHT